MSSKEEFLKIKTCVLKVNIHCDGCQQKVKKILKKIDGVFTTQIDAEQGKVTVSGNAEPSVLIKKLSKCGKHAELWSTTSPSPKPNNIQLDNAIILTNNNQKLNNNNNHNQPKAFQQNNLQQIKALQGMMPQSNDRIKALQDVMPQLKGQKLPPNQPNQKSPNFASLKDYGDCSWDEFDDGFDEDDGGFDDDDDLEGPNHAVNNIKPSLPPMVGGNGNVSAMPAVNPHLMNVHKGGSAPQNGVGNGKKGGGPNGVVPVQINGGIQGSGPCTNNQNGGNPGGGKPQNVKAGNGGGGGGGGGGGISNGFGGGGGNGFNDNSMHSAMSQIGNMNLRPNGNMPMGRMSNIPTVQGLPAAATMSNRGGGGGPDRAGGYFKGAGPDPMPGNPYHQQQQQQQQQQQYLAAMINQEKAMGGGNEGFQHMMYARPPPMVNYMPPIPNINPNPNPNPDPYLYPYQYQYQRPYPYPYPNQHGPDPDTNMFNDESTSSCNVM